MTVLLYSRSEGPSQAGQPYDPLDHLLELADNQALDQN